MGRFTLFLFCTLSVLTIVYPQTRGMRLGSIQANQNRMALVIGNARYTSAPLRNPENDAWSVSRALKTTGFDVLTFTNLDQKATKRAIRAFGERLSAGGVALFYYSGHGVQIKGANYLIPVGAEIAKEGDVELEGVDANYVLNEMDAAKSRVNIVILDACRDNPLPRSVRSASRGLAQMNAPVGTIIAFATSPGSVASDGSGLYGLYTQELVKNITVPGLPIETVFKRTLSAVKQKSGGSQVPWTSYSIEGDFYFLDAPPRANNDSKPLGEGLRDNAPETKTEDKPAAARPELVRKSDLPVYVSDLREIAAVNIMQGVGHDSTNWGYPLRVSGVVYTKGIVTHPDRSPGYVEYALDESFSYFRAMIAMLDDCSAGGPYNGNAVFTVEVDGRRVFQSPMLEWDQRNSMAVDVDVRGARVLRLGVSNGDGKTWSDHAAWINARLE